MGSTRSHSILILLFVSDAEIFNTWGGFCLTWVAQFLNVRVTRLMVIFLFQRISVLIQQFNAILFLLKMGSTRSHSSLLLFSCF